MMISLQEETKKSLRVYVAPRISSRTFVCRPPPDFHSSASVPFLYRCSFTVFRSRFSVCIPLLIFLCFYSATYAPSIAFFHSCSFDTSSFGMRLSCESRFKSKLDKSLISLVPTLVGVHLLEYRVA